MRFTTEQLVKIYAGIEASQREKEEQQVAVQVEEPKRKKKARIKTYCPCGSSDKKTLAIINELVASGVLKPEQKRKRPYYMMFDKEVFIPEAEVKEYKKRYPIFWK